MRDKIAKLRMSIDLHSRLYDRGTPLISDAAYDALIREYSELTGKPAGAPVSPPVVGAEPLGLNGKTRHPARMLSLSNAFDRAQRAAAWFGIQRQAADAEGYADLKVDGMALRLQYDEAGSLVAAATRGNGQEGEDVYQSALRMETVLKKLPEKLPCAISVVGEAYIADTDFTLLNQERDEAGLERYSSSRNCAAGGMRHSDPNEAAARRIRFMAYGLLDPDARLGFACHSEIMDWLELLGFETVKPHIAGIRTESEMEAAFRELSGYAATADFPCDGVVVKLDGLAGRAALGEGGAAPNWAFACKFKAQAARTRLEDVYFTVGRTGAVTPVGVVKPTAIGGVTIDRVTLHNETIVNRLDLRIGDTVLLKRAGDVIPAVTQAFAEERDGSERQVAFPAECPGCGSTLARQGGARLYCENSALCPAQLQRSLEHFAGQDYMAIRGAGPALIRQLTDAGLVERVSDLYRLTAKDLTALPGFGQKKAGNLLGEIAKSRSQPLHRLIAALGIREVGRSASVALEGRFGALDALLDATYEEARQVEGFGPKMAQSFCDYMANENNRRELLLLHEFGVGRRKSSSSAPQTDERNGAALPLSGLNVCATGKLLNYDRRGINALIAKLGGSAQSSVSARTDLLIVGERAGGKLAKARNLGVPALTEREFERCIGDDALLATYLNEQNVA